MAGFGNLLVRKDILLVLHTRGKHSYPSFFPDPYSVIFQYIYAIRTDQNGAISISISCF
jgi:hypothetical protein